MNSGELSSSLREVVSALHKGLRKQMSVVNSYSMTEMETIGHLIRNASLLPTELASLARVKTQSMSHILNKLEEQRVIKRTPAKDDKRKVYISLTVLGRKIVEKTKYERDEWLKGVIERSLTHKEKDLLAKALPVLNKLLETK
ncbi:MAG TPA: MarR family transcriptional regulator [Bacteroidia bacterium]|jgi:DNA-binding MarR family transcriptional regulator|nr:MarR family transcriptional regulator [Bacteroidia bacterium]